MTDPILALRTEVETRLDCNSEYFTSTIIHFTKHKGSDSVRLALHLEDTKWAVEVHSHKFGEIKDFPFINKESAITAFKMWCCYYETVVVENCKNF